MKTRLYIYPDVDREVVTVITVGGKNTQPDDIKLCSEFIEQLRQSKTQPPQPRKEPS